MRGEIQTFLAGAVLGNMYLNIDSITRKHRLVIITSLLLCIFNHFLMHGAQYGGFFALVLVVMYLVANKYTEFVIAPKWILFLSEISYPLYLVHENIGWIIIRELERNGYTNEIYIIIPITSMVIVASIVHEYIEIPTNKYLELKIKNIEKRMSVISYR